MSRLPNSRSKYDELIKSIFNPDSKGISEWVEVINLEGLGFKWTKNGNIRRGAPWEDKSYEWEYRRRSESSKSEILALRTIGFSERNSVSSTIRKDIQEQIKRSKFCNFSLLPVPIKDKEVDHRFGYKEHSKYADINNQAKQKISHFQLLHLSLIHISEPTRPY